MHNFSFVGFVCWCFRQRLPERGNRGERTGEKKSTQLFLRLVEGDWDGEEQFVCNCSGREIKKGGSWQRVVIMRSRSYFTQACRQYSQFTKNCFRSFNNTYYKRPNHLQLRNSGTNISNKFKTTGMMMMGLVTITDSIRDGLVKNEIIPTVIHDEKFTPKGFLMINYENKEVTMGNKLKPEETSTRPQINFTLNIGDKEDDKIAIQQDDRFTLVMTDPDAPTKEDDKWSEYCHYVTTDIKLNTHLEKSKNAVAGAEAGAEAEAEAKESINQEITELTTIDLKGSDLVPYVGPGPPPGTGFHRYVFLLYKGVPTKEIADRPCWGTSIPGWGAAEFAEENNLELWGVNFFYCKNHEQ